MNPDRAPRREPVHGTHPALSPDERWLAFVSNQSGQPEVYVRPLQTEGEQAQVSLAGGSEPLWGPDGRERFDRSPDERESQLIAATVRTTPHFAVTARRALFSLADIVGSNPHTGYGISPDGRTFAMVRRSPATRIMVIQNLPALVRRLRGAAEERRWLRPTWCSSRSWREARSLPSQSRG